MDANVVEPCSPPFELPIIIGISCWNIRTIYQRRVTGLIHDRLIMIPGTLPNKQVVGQEIQYGEKPLVTDRQKPIYMVSNHAKCRSPSHYSHSVGHSSDLGFQQQDPCIAHQYIYHKWMGESG